MVSIYKAERNTHLAEQLLHFAEKCSWTEVKDHIAEMIRSWEFTDWECMFVAVKGDNIIGMASIMKTDYYPLPGIFPWISCIFVTESERGQKISGMLIDYANSYAKDMSFTKTYIPTEFTGLYEHYG